MMQSVKHNDTRSRCETGNGRQTVEIANLAMRPVSSAEVAQARIFERILQAEFAQLSRAYSTTGLTNYSDARDVAGGRPSQELVRMHARMDEVHRLLQGLKGRFRLHPDEWCADSA